MKNKKRKWLGFVGEDNQLVGGTIVGQRRHWFWGNQYRIVL